MTQNPGASNIRQSLLKLKGQLLEPNIEGPRQKLEPLRETDTLNLWGSRKEGARGQISRPHFSPIITSSNGPNRKPDVMASHWCKLKSPGSQDTGHRRQGPGRAQRGTRSRNKKYTFTKALKLYYPIRNYEFSAQKLVICTIDLFIYTNDFLVLQTFSTSYL